MKVTAIKKLGKYQVGDVFEFPDKAARVFIKAKILKEVIEAAVAEDISPRTGRPKRTYQRRDMQAES